MDFIGTTSLTGFVFTDLEPNAKIFVVRHWAPRFFTTFRLQQHREDRQTVGPPDEDGELVEETIKERIGDTVKVIIGTADYRKETMVDLTDIS